MTEFVRTKAKQSNIQLLFVPKGLTWAFQPLDFKVFGPFKTKIKSYWFKNKFNTEPYHDASNKSKYHLNVINTILTSYSSLTTELIVKSSQCITN